MRVAVLGTGLMGAGMARSLLRSKVDVAVWNRSLVKARPLADEGAVVADDPKSAVVGADVVLTMLFDADATAGVMAEALPSVERGAVWVQCGTVGLAGVDHLAELAAAYGVPFVDAPVLGTRTPAEQGKLTVLAAGPVEVREFLAPVFDAVALRTVWAGERPGDGQRLKLAANSWVLSITAATAQAVALTRGLGLDPDAFLEVIAGGPVDSTYAQVKGRAMIDGEFSASFGVDGAVKDGELIVAAMAAAGTDDRLMRVVNEHYRVAAGKVGDGADMASVIAAFGS
ncbi:NAD(P)-dependent oxidoreductase [Saccharothrix sp. 6-C]|uniref:3-hydroxyisobutyrate dehydrogenase n=1 Tax=Saccharothrix texasensis TaxID=103734 RepID=A0A3N1H362_9PSEU|nr:MULTISPECIES: NAD(P)-dependent oxidoreductase [Saccharothrix]QQQ78371.1 NAD(P)-dependent oxidoreductase [Saccharothrix sp. 6-C]ROP36973.1 3-hydroxyisobutyrate dehydrogenase [Saccharothrix texasensis]